MFVMLSGKQGSGKTTIAQKLQTHWSLLGVPVCRTKFAKPLYEMHDAVFAVGKMYGVLPPPGGKDGDLLQVLGTEWGRMHRGKDIWVDCLKADAAQMTEGWRQHGMLHIVLVDDLRFKNEFDGIPGAMRVRLECDEDIRKKRASYWRENTSHLSETDLDDCLDRFELIVDTGVLDVELSVQTIVEHFRVKIESAFVR
jgi:hypothetical protein